MCIFTAPREYLPCAHVNNLILKEIVVFTHNTAIGAFGLTGDMFGAEYYFYNNITFDTDKPTSNSIQTSGIPGVLASIVNNNGNLVATNPLFVEASTDNDIANFSLTPESPAINAGHEANFAPMDILQQPRPVGARADIGAYEYPVDLGVNVPLLDPMLRKLELFPNPVRSTLKGNHENLDGEVQVRIFSLSGKEVQNQRVVIQNGNFEINVEDIQSGVYFLKTGDNEKATVSKFVKL